MTTPIRPADRSGRPHAFACLFIATIAWLHSPACGFANPIFSESLPAQRTSPTVTIAENVEPHVAEAFAEALALLPETLASIHPALVIDRAPALSVPVSAPLSDRLLGRAALMVYRSAPPRITVFDSAVHGGPTWGQPAPDARALGTFLNDLADVLRIERADSFGADADRIPLAEPDAAWLDRAWSAFVERVHDLDGSPRPEPPPPLGDPSVFDRFLRVGVRISLGGFSADDPDALVGLFVHELGHAVQYGRDPDGHLRRWGELSGWRHREARAAFAGEHLGPRATGRVGGVFRTEDPIVLIRLILGDRRRGVLYSTPCTRCFVTAYAEYDMAEDFAECIRLMSSDPARLAAISPEKFMFVNAVGWNADLDFREPGPLWIDAARIQESGWRDHLVDAANRLLSDDDHAIDGPQYDVHTIVALLRAHAEVLAPAELPRPHRFPKVPTDMPAAIFAAATADDLVFTIGGTSFSPPPSAVIAAWESAYGRRRDIASLHATMAELLGSAEGLRREYVDEVRGEPDPQVRADRFFALLPGLRKHVDHEHVRAMANAEADFHQRRGRPLIATRIRVVAGLVSAEEVPFLDRKSIDHADAVELQFELARAAIDRIAERTPLEPPPNAADEPSAAAAFEAIASLPQSVEGSFRRVELLMHLSDRLATESIGGDESDAARQWRVELRAEAIAAARLELEKLAWPRLRRDAERLIDAATAP